VASGDANLYLRNVLLLIKDRGKLQELITSVKVVFPGFHLFVQFNPQSDLHISVSVSLTGPQGRKTPLELMGTGVQQALQIFSYVVLFQPYLLLLDEPDSHLHPDNQGLLSKALLAIASTTDTKVIISTHSRHLVDALYDESNIVWLKNGVIHQQGDEVGRIPLLMDLGALDSFEKIREGEVGWVFLTEDASLELVKTLIRSSGFGDDEIVVYSYKTSSNIHAALTLSEFILEIAPDTKVIIHRDRDFMTNDEVNWTTQIIGSTGAIPFITEGVDIESYFQVSEHLAALLEVELEEINDWKTEIARRAHNELVHKYLRKRDEARALYRNRLENPPDSMSMLGTEAPLPEEKRLGKYMLRKLRGSMQDRFCRTVDLNTRSDWLFSKELADLKGQHGA
jgi:energy-coupling factor transporter ATP-binding protein EcfA2